MPQCGPQNHTSTFSPATVSGSKVPPPWVGSAMARISGRVSAVATVVWVVVVGGAVVWVVGAGVVGGAVVWVVVAVEAVDEVGADVAGAGSVEDEVEESHDEAVGSVEVSAAAGSVVVGAAPSSVTATTTVPAVAAVVTLVVAWTAATVAADASNEPSEPVGFAQAPAKTPIESDRAAAALVFILR